MATNRDNVDSPESQPDPTRFAPVVRADEEQASPEASRQARLRGLSRGSYGIPPLLLFLFFFIFSPPYVISSPARCC